MGKLNFYQFSVEWANVFEVGGKESDGGFLRAKNYADAAAQIEEYYGEDLIAIVYLEALDCGKLLRNDDIEKKLLP